MINRISIVLLLLAILTDSCSKKEPVFENFRGFTQGTNYSIVYEKKRRISSSEIKNEVENILSDFDLSLSLYKDSSIISRINRNEDVVIDSYFEEAFIISRQVYELTSGAFDITVGPLVKAWGFGPEETKNFTESKRDSLLRLVGMDKVSLQNGRIIKSDPGINLDLNAIAQGYSVDVLCRYFDGLGISNYLIEIGGEVRGKGTRAGADWRIGIDKPVDNNMSPGQTLEAIIRISSKALATSGNYRKFYIENGIKYSHTIDPATGYPAKNTLLSATIIADDCATADAVATACMVMGKEKSIDFIHSHPQFEAYFIFSDESGNFRTWISDNLKDHISETGE